MNSVSPGRSSGAAEISRIEMLFARLPSSIAAALVGIFLCFVVLFGTIPLDSLKAWTAYMLSVFAGRVWIWYMFGRTDRRSASIRRWEWLFAAGAFFTSLGWGALFGPLHPPPAHPDAQVFMLLLVMVVAFIGSIFLAVSNIAFWLFIIPTLLPAIAHYALVMGRAAQWPLSAAAAAAGLAIFVLVQRTLYRSATDSLQRSTEAESLLAEQQAIFESSPMGIAVIDNNQVVKCNTRFGELLGRRIHELTRSSIHEHFVSTAEAARFLDDSVGAFDRGQLAQGMYRLRRADGSEFWAELSGRKMAGGMTHSVWMIADVTLRVANERRSRQRV